MPTIYTTNYSNMGSLIPIQQVDNIHVFDGMLDMSEYLLYCYTQTNLTLNTLFYECCTPKKDEHPRKIVQIAEAIKSSRILILTLGKLDDLDTLLLPDDKIVRIDQIVEWLNYTIIFKKCDIWIDFSQVFLVEAGQTPGSNYLPERDRIVNTEEEYKAETSKFSYQIAKAFTGFVSKPISDSEHHFNHGPGVFSTLGYSGWQHCNSTKPVFPHNDLTHLLEMKFFIKYGCIFQHITLRLGPHMSVTELEDCHSELTKTKTLKELVIILSGKQYQIQANRQKVIENVLAMITAKNWCFFPYIFFMPDLDGQKVSYVHELQVEATEEGGCRLLHGNQGYYVCDKRIFAAVSRNIQNQTQQQSLELYQIFNKEDDSSILPAKSSTYIVENGLPTVRYRKSKRLDPQQLRAGINFTVTQNYVQTHESTQNQSQQQQQELTQQQEFSQVQTTQSQRKRQFGFDIFRQTMGFGEFRSELEMMGRQHISYPTSRDQLLRKNHFFTQHFCKTNLKHRLASEPGFAEKITSRIFGRSPYDPHRTGLDRGSFVHIDRAVALRMLEDIYSIIDGMDFENIELETGWYTVAMMLIFRQATLIYYKKDYVEAPFYSSYEYLGSLSTYGSSWVTLGIQAATLLRPDDVTKLPISEQENWARIAPELLKFFAISSPVEDKQPEETRRNIRTLYQYHCPDSDLALLDKLLVSLPKFNRDYALIFLLPIVMGYQHKAQQLLILLTILERRGLLDTFAKIYIEYAVTINSLAILLQMKKHRVTRTQVQIDAMSSYTESVEFEVSGSLFLDVLHRIPAGCSLDGCPPFEKFVVHFLLYTSKLNILIKYLTIQDFKLFWQRMHAKILRYHHGDHQAADQCMAIMVEHLICSKNGLVIAPVGLAATVFDGIEKMVEHGIHCDSLEEIIREWRGVSLLRTDGLYAALDDRFTVISQEMALDITNLHLLHEVIPYRLLDSKSSYVVTASHLRQLLQAQCLEDYRYDNFVITVFRYLGKQSLREPIDFYRQLLHLGQRNTDPAALYFSYLLLGYWIMTKTGENYTRDCDPQRLYQEFLQFLLQKNYIPSNNDYLLEEYKKQQENDLNQIMYTKIKHEYKEIIAQCVRDFVQYARANFPDQSQKKHESLWSFYQKKLPKETQVTDTVTYVNQGLSWLGLSTADKVWESNSVVNQSLAALGLVNHPTFETIPPVFKKRFSLLTVANFFVLQQAELIKSSAIFSGYPHILNELMVAKIREQFAATQLEKKKSGAAEQFKQSKLDIYRWLSGMYSAWSVEQFISNITDIELLITHFSELALEEDYPIWRESYLELIYQQGNIKTAILVLNVMAKQRQSEQYRPENMQKIFQHVLQFPQLLVRPEQAEALLPEIFTVCMEYSDSPYMNVVYPLAQKLSDLEPAEAVKTLKILLSCIPWQQKTDVLDLFYLYTPMSAQQLQSLAQLLEDKTWDLSILGRIIQNEPQIDLYKACEKYQSLETAHRRALCNIAGYISGERSESILNLLERINQHPKSSVLLLNRLIQLYQLDTQQVLALINSLNFKQDLKKLEKEIYARNLQRFNYDKEALIRNIAKIRKKTWVEGEEDQPLSVEEPKRLLDDYQLMMSYMQRNPVLYAADDQGVQRHLTIHELDEEQCQFLYQKLSFILQNPDLSRDEKHGYRLVLLALCAEVHYRTTKKFPRHTQFLCDLHAIDDPQAQMQEVKTSGGKSIISELRAVTLCAEGWTVDIATENIELADVALNNFKPFYEYLDIPHAKSVIKPNSAHRDYVTGGIHHSTPAYLSFFRAIMALKKKSLPKHIALLCDEIDAILTTTIQYRLAGVIDPIYSDSKSWSVVFSELLNFVQEQEIYLQNTCDDQYDVHNFKIYFSQRQTDKNLVKFVEKIPEEILDVFLNSARIPEVLTEGEDYLPIKREYNQKKQQYAAPIMNVGTKRPEPSVSISDGGQQFVHMANNAKLKRGDWPFIMEAITETLMIISAKNFFDTYSLVIGWTGSPGAKPELREFYHENGLIAHYYPIYQPDRSEYLGVEIHATRALQHAAILAHIRQKRSQYPNQPLPVFLDSPKAVGEFYAYLRNHAPDLQVQTYDGYEADGMSEKELVKRAGAEDIVTLTTLSLSRGTDFETDFSYGFGGIGAAADITETEAIQTEGRVGRDGKLGQFKYIICAEDLNPATANIFDPAERFKAHQRLIGQQRQRDRLKTRFLENTRHYIVTEYFLKLRQEADHILEEQQGIYASLISEKDFLKALRDFNKQSEQLYMQLLGSQAELSTAQQEEFRQKLIENYQSHLERLVPNHVLEQIQVIEPLIALHGLQNVPLPAELKLRDMRAISDILSTGWRTLGHQSMVKLCELSDDVLNEFQPYFEDECSLRVSTAQVLERRQILKIPKVVAEIERIKISVNEFNLQEIVSGIQTGLNNQNATLAQGIGQMLGMIFTEETLKNIKEYVLGYLEETKIKISEKRWDDLTLPNLQVEWIQLWLARVNLIWSTFGWITFGAAFVAGPLPFIITRFVLPALLRLVKNLVKIWFVNSESQTVQILLGLDNACDDLARVLNTLYTKDMRTLTIDELFQDFLPIFNNKAIQMISTKMLENAEQGEQFFQLLPDVTKALEPYRHLPVKEIKRPEIIVAIVVKVLQSEFFKKMMDAEEHAIMLECIQALPNNFSTIFKDCTLPQLMTIFKILAHPRFNQCLAQLPSDAGFPDLVQWLQANPDALPDVVQNPMRELHDYQNNHERIAQETQATYKNIKQKFSLRQEDLCAHHAQLYCRRQAITEPAVLAPATMWELRFYLQWAKVIVPYIAMLIMNYLFFNFSVLLITGVFISLLAIPLLKNMYVTWLENKIANEQMKRPIQPFVMPRAQENNVAIPQDPLPGDVEHEPEMAPVARSQPSTAGYYQNFSLFTTRIKLPDLSNIPVLRIF
ncbi:MAG: hypothetical protein ACO1N3_01865 [Gammaproteobacteria bacterium]